MKRSANRMKLGEKRNNLTWSNQAKCDVHRQLHATIHQNAYRNYCNWLEFSIFYIVDVLHKNINRGFKKSDCTLVGLMSNPAFCSISWNAKNCRLRIQTIVHKTIDNYLWILNFWSGFSWGLKGEATSSFRKTLYPHF
jgi:hypothetical protein